MSDQQIEIFNNAFKASGVRGNSEKYQGALHGFTMADLPAGNAEAIEKHWKNLFALFRTLKN
jgi:carboxymethylenebutenolidase